MNVITPRHKIGSHDPGSAGMLREAVENTIVLPFNDLDAVARALDRNRGQVAGLILEPIPHNIGCVLPCPGYLEGLRELLLKRGIFKLPMSLKRSHIGGAHTEEDIDRTLSAAEDAFRRLVHRESHPVALQSGGTESGEPK